MSQDSTDAQESPSRPKRSWFRFSLRTLLLLMLLVAVFLGGRNSNKWFRPPVEGVWQLTMPGGYQQKVNIARDPGGLYALGTGGVLSGAYRWEKDRLIVVAPSDRRMIGLIWAWDGKKLRLVSEPKGTPTGSSYVGAVMERIDD